MPSRTIRSTSRGYVIILGASIFNRKHSFLNDPRHCPGASAPGLDQEILIRPDAAPEAEIGQTPGVNQVTCRPPTAARRILCEPIHCL